MSPSRASARAGFTLFEVLISLAVLVSITTLVYSSLSGTLRMTEIAQEDEATVNAARVTMSRLSRELSMTFMDPRVYASARRSARRDQTTVVENYITAFVGEDSSPIDKLTFASFSHVRLYHGTKEGDQAEIAWFGEPDEESQGLYKLMHREAGRIDGEWEEGGVTEVLARGVQELNLEYYDGRKEEWVESWDFQSQETRLRLPKAVAISLKLVDSEGFVHSYRTRVSLNLWRALPPRMMGRAPRKTAGGGNIKRRRPPRPLRRRRRLC